MPSRSRRIHRRAAPTLAAKSEAHTRRGLRFLSALSVIGGEILPSARTIVTRRWLRLAVTLAAVDAVATLRAPESPSIALPPLLCCASAARRQATARRARVRSFASFAQGV
jgi:hypothetical protein